MASRFKRSVPVTVNDVLDGHVALDLECLDRVYLHGYLGQLPSMARPPSAANKVTTRHARAGGVKHQMKLRCQRSAGVWHCPA